MRSSPISHAVLITSLMGAGILGGSSPAFALPDTPNVTSGSASVSTVGNDMTVNQTSSSVFINWNSFDIGVNESVTFNQPSTSALAINRVVTNNPSEIFGALNANGRVVLINQNGILFGAGAQVNLNGLIATTIDIDPASPASGNLVFNGPTNPTATVANGGHITLTNPGGVAALVGPGVSNTGIIEANLGRVNLGAGTAFTIDLNGDGLVQLTAGTAQTPIDLGSGIPMNALARNDGTLRADGGRVLITAQAASGVLDTVINMDGIAQAQSVAGQNGQVILLGQGASYGSGRVDVGGTIDVSGLDAGESGGRAEILGRYVNLLDATIDARGTVNGGSGLIGGDPANPYGAKPLAIGTYVSYGTQIRTNAGQSDAFPIYGYVVSLGGNMPLHLSAGHDGTLTPAEIPNRVTGNMGRDTNTIPFGLSLSDAMFAQYGARPYFVYSNLRRTKVDLNRALDSADNGTVAVGSLGAEIYEAWENLNGVAHTEVQNFAGGGFYIDIHGFLSTVDPQNPTGPFEIIWSYGASIDDFINGAVANTNNLSIRNYCVTNGMAACMEFMRGANSLPALMEAMNYPGTPSPANPIPYDVESGYTAPQAIVDYYYRGGYNTYLYGSRYGGDVDGLQMELPQYIRNVETTREQYAIDLADAFGTFFQANYNIDLASFAAAAPPPAAPPPPPSDGTTPPAPPPAGADDEPHAHSGDDDPPGNAGMGGGFGADSLLIQTQRDRADEACRAILIDPNRADSNPPELQERLGIQPGEDGVIHLITDMRPQSAAATSFCAERDERDRQLSQSIKK